MKWVFVLLGVLVCASGIYAENLRYSLNGLTEEELGWHNALDMVDKSDVIVVGTVQLMTSKLTTKTILTEVLVRVSDFVKGKPNVGNNHVKFFIVGGTAYDPELGEVIRIEEVGGVEFEIGEKALLFLGKDDDDDLYVHMGKFGKRPIKDGKVMFAYGTPGAAKKLEMPLDLAKALGKAYQEDKNATIAIENEIKALSELGNTKAEQLTNHAKRIAEGD